MKGESASAKRVSTNLVDNDQRVATTDDLLSQLTLIKDAFVWYVTGQGRICAFLKNDPQKRVFDPFTAVIYGKTGHFFGEGRWTAAATAANFSLSDCAAIVAASNYDWDPSCRQGALRRELLTTLQLQPNASPTSPTSSSFLSDTLFRGLRRRFIATH